MRNGLTAERKVARLLERFGYLVASRRHFGGAGDVLAVHKGLARRPLLVEVKAVTGYPWSNGFGPDERYEMVAAALRYDVEPILAWLPPYLGGVIWLPVVDWPPT